MNPEGIRKSYETTLLGRLKLKLFQEITGISDKIPSSKEHRLALLDKYKNSFVAGRLFFDILRARRTTGVEFSSLVALSDVRSLLNSLEHDPLDEVVFVEVSGCPVPGVDNLGILIRREHLDPAGYFYVVTVIDEAVFPDMIAGRAEVRCYEKQPEPVFGLFAGDNFEPYTFNNWQSESLLRLIVCVLGYLDAQRKLPLSLNQIRGCLGRVISEPTVRALAVSWLF